MNTIPEFRPITYGPHEMRNPKTEERIRFLEDPSNNDKPLPEHFADYERTYIERYGRAGYAQILRKDLQGGSVGG